MLKFENHGLRGKRKEWFYLVHSLRGVLLERTSDPTSFWTKGKEKMKKREKMTSEICRFSVRSSAENKDVESLGS